jgi:hypothetical protein
VVGAPVVLFRNECSPPAHIGEEDKIMGTLWFFMPKANPNYDDAEEVEENDFERLWAGYFLDNPHLNPVMYGESRLRISARIERVRR